MSKPTTGLQQRIASGQAILLAELTPPTGAEPAPLRDAAARLAKSVHAIGVSDNRDRVTMSALAAASVVAAAGVEPILHITTRDRNRVALVSEILGAQALGIRNVLCTSGTHQTLGRYRAAKNVFDLDSIQLLQTYSQLASDGGLLGEKQIADAGPFCLGGVASPEADPLELQIGRLAKKTAAGAAFLITHPVFDLERFDAWWKALAQRGIHEKVAIVAGIAPLTDAELQPPSNGACPQHRVPEAIRTRLAAQSSAARRAAAIEIAAETVKRLSTVKGLRGFCLACDGDLDAALEVIEKSGLGS